MSVFLAVPLLVLVAVSGMSTLLSERLARGEALDVAQRSAVALTRFVIAPTLADVIKGVPGARETLDGRVQDRLADGSIAAVLIWRPPREVLYSSAPVTVPDAGTTMRKLRAAAEDHLSADIVYEAEPGSPTVKGPLVEVYLPLSAAGAATAAAVFFRYDGIKEDARLLRNRIILATVGALVILQLFQVPLGLSLFRRVRRQDAERTNLLARSLTAADQERRAIAADIHDGPVQDLAGVAYALGSLRTAGSAERQSTVDDVVAPVREAVAWLRRLMVDVYPPDLGPSAMPTALADLAESLRSNGSVVDLDVEPVPGVSSDGAAALYRTAKDALSDQWCGATAHHSWLQYGPATLHGRTAVRMEVGHDCADAVLTVSGGYPDRALGLRLMRARIADLGGSLDIATDGRKSVLTAVLPAPE